MIDLIEEPSEAIDELIDVVGRNRGGGRVAVVGTRADVHQESGWRVGVADYLPRGDGL